MEPNIGERVGIGRGAEVFAWGEGRVIKLLRQPAHAPWLTRELAAQRAASLAGVHVPEAFEIVEHDGRPGLVMARVDGRDGLSLMEKEPWRIWSIGAEVGHLHATLASVPAPEGLPSFREQALRDISASPFVPEAARARLLAILENLPEGDRLCHLDLHPANVMFGDGEPVVIDFASSRRGDPMADHAKSLVLLEAGSPVEMGLWQRLLVLFGRRLARAAYTRGYGKLSNEDRARAIRWRPVIIGQRFVEGIEGEREPLLRMLSRALKAAEGTGR